jgi:hypothetical protein
VPILMPHCESKTRKTLFKNWPRVLSLKLYVKL